MKHQASQINSIDIIETTHLRLCKPVASEILSLRELWQNEKVRQFLGGIISDESIDQKIVSLQEHWKIHGFGQWVVYEKDAKQEIGICGLHCSEDGVELSYMFFPEFWGRGFAREAALASLQYGFDVLKLERVIAITQEANQRSCRLLECIGMRYMDNLWRFNASQRLYEITQV